MESIGFPRMFNTNATIVKYDKEATMQNLKLLLRSEKGEMLGDPFLGIRLKSYTYSQNNIILQDLLIDEILEQVANFMPQLRVKRSDIEITQVGADVYCTFKAQNVIDYTTDMYSILLFKEGNAND